MAILPKYPTLYGVDFGICQIWEERKMSLWCSTQFATPKICAILWQWRENFPFEHPDAVSLGKEQQKNLLAYRILSIEYFGL